MDRTEVADPSDLSEGMVVTVFGDGRITLEAPPLTSEGLLAFSRRLCGTAGVAEAISAANDGVEVLQARTRYRVPLDLLRPALQRAVFQRLFTADRETVDGWRHVVRGSRAGVGSTGVGGGESLWRIAEWFTGDGANFTALRDVNRLPDYDLSAGQEIFIPKSLLRPALRSESGSATDQISPAAERIAAGTARGGRGDVAVPFEPVQPEVGGPPDAGSAAVETGTQDPQAPSEYRLEYGRDDQGAVAIYRLRAGEALYSSVVVRYTGRIFASDVNALAAEIAERSGIDDVTDIPVGYEVKIPTDLLLPEHLPLGDPRRVEYEASLRETGQFINRVRAGDLKGITVLLDAGHGGADPGASFGDVWESLYVYDIMVRVKQLLERHTEAKVVPLTRDGERFQVTELDVLPFSRRHSVLTTPPYPIADARIGTNLRWYFANSVYKRTARSGKDSDKVIFLSIHADSLHPSLRGAMAYVPAAALRKGRHGKTGAVYSSRKEYRDGPTVSFSWKDRVRSEGLSRELANHVVTSLRKRDILIHPYKPVRDKVIRRRNEQWVPAVLRYNAVPAKLLLEVCNLANSEDRARLQTRAFRQKAADAIVEAILEYYGQGDPAGQRRAAAGS